MHAGEVPFGIVANRVDRGRIFLSREAHYHPTLRP